MARVTRASKLKDTPSESPAKSPATPKKTTEASKADTPLKSVEDANATGTNRQKQKSARRQRFNKKQRDHALEALKELPKDQRKPARAAIYGKRASEPKVLTELQKTIRKQQEEIEELKKQVGDSKSPEATSGGSARKASGGRAEHGLRARKTTSV